MIGLRRAASPTRYGANSSAALSGATSPRHRRAVPPRAAHAARPHIHATHGQPSSARNWTQERSAGGFGLSDASHTRELPGGAIPSLEYGEISAWRGSWVPLIL